MPPIDPRLQPLVEKLNELSSHISDLWSVRASKPERPHSQQPILHAEPQEMRQSLFARLAKLFRGR